MRFLAWLPIALPPVFRSHFLNQSLSIAHCYYWIPDLKVVALAICAVSLPTTLWSAIHLKVTVLLSSELSLNPSTIRLTCIIAELASSLFVIFIQVQSSVQLSTIESLTAVALTRRNKLTQPFKMLFCDHLPVTANLRLCLQNPLFITCKLRFHHRFFF